MNCPVCPDAETDWPLGVMVRTVIGSEAPPCTVKVAVPVTTVLLELLANDAERGALGKRAAETMRSQIGAIARMAGEMEKLLAQP